MFPFGQIILLGPTHFGESKFHTIFVLIPPHTISTGHCFKSAYTHTGVNGLCNIHIVEMSINAQNVVNGLKYVVADIYRASNRNTWIMYIEHFKIHETYDLKSFQYQTIHIENTQLKVQILTKKKTPFTISPYVFHHICALHDICKHLFVLNLS